MDRRYAVLVAMLVMGCGVPPTAAEVGEVDSELSRGDDAARARSFLLPTRDDSGLLASVVDGDAAALMARAPAEHAFFKSFGANGRACIHCHVPSADWSLTPEVAQLRFTNPLDLRDPACIADPYRCRAERDPRNWGKDPLFRAVDGAVSPRADVRTTEARLAAYKLLLDKGLIRVGMAVPRDAEFVVDHIDDPYRYATSAELSLFRRPLPATNLRTGDGAATLSAIMWDGREPDLGHQANDATLGHAEALRDLDPASQQAIVEFESHLHTAQLVDRAAGVLDLGGAAGGPRALAAQRFYPGINDVFAGDARTGKPFSADVFTIYETWQHSHDPARARVARGEAIFNRKPFVIRGVGGLNDVTGGDIVGTCSSCHDSPNYGHHSVALAVDLGVSDGARRTADLPLYTLRNVATGELRRVTDPGRAMVTGKWRDIGKFKGPILRGAAARAPYFHDGSAASLEDVVKFYDARFSIGLSDDERRDLVAFLRTL